MTVIYDDSFVFFLGLFRPIWLHVELNVPLTRTKAKEIGSFLEKLGLPIIGCQYKKKRLGTKKRSTAVLQPLLTLNLIL